MKISGAFRPTLLTIALFCTATLVVGLGCVGAHAAEWHQNNSVNENDRVKYTIRVLARDYDPVTGLWKTEGWWNAANTVTALASAGAGNDVRATLENTFRKAPKKASSFLNEYYDDEGWWALAWIQAYDLTHQKRFLTTSQSIFQDMTTGWDDTCGGGIWWKKDRHYKNAIANELFLSVAAHLANRTPGKAREQYLAWASREWSWFDKSGMINDESLVNDGLTPDCKNNGRNTWSYNQGVILGGLSELSRATDDAALVKRANLIASAAIDKLSDSEHVLHDKTEPKCSADTVQFKGIFMRNLGELNERVAEPKYRSFLRINADAIWSKARDDDRGFACSWSGPPSDGGAAATTSALDAFNAAE